MRVYLIGGFCFLALFSLTIPLVEYQPPLSARESDHYPPAVKLDPLIGIWHSCQQGETLRSIAMDYYGSAREWRTLQIANSAPLIPEVNTLLWIPGMREDADRLSDTGVVSALSANR